MTYDEWKLETPEDEYARKHGSPCRGVYTVTVRRTTVEYTTIELQASSENDARDDAETQAQFVNLSAWTADDADYEAIEIEGPPERDPDDARDD